jgi:hypothetical protein
MPLNEREVLVRSEDGSEETLPVSHDLCNHSPIGFAWGYGGSRPAQLALAMLAYLYGDIQALRYYQSFKDDTVTGLKQNEGWEMTAEQVDLRLEALKAKVKFFQGCI